MREARGGAGAFAYALLLVIAVMAAIPLSAHAARPNVVVIVTDDQTLESFNPKVMPRTIRKLADRGTSFSEAIVATPQCCPSRAGFLTGQYPQNNRVIANRPGYPLLKKKAEVLPAWLHRAGYETIHLGKFLNGYVASRGFEAAPGWNRWSALSQADYLRPVFANGKRFTGRPRGYLTSTLNRLAKREISRAARHRRPFYLQIDHLAPHVGSGDEQSACQGGAIPTDTDLQRFSGEEVPQNPARAETDLGDKPEYIRRRPPLDAETRARVEHFYGCALASLQAVDRGVAGVVRRLRQVRELGRTMIVFTSDNGYSYGEHRIALGKGLPYEESLRVPLVIRPPRGRGIPRSARRGAVSDAPVANIDLAPTILRMAKARPCKRSSPRRCRRMDGRSLVSLLRGRRPDWTRTRAIHTSFDINLPEYSRSCAWNGFRTPGRSVVQHVMLPQSGGMGCRPASDFEHYDLSSDPYQLEGGLPIWDGLVRRLDRLERCSGIRGRDRARRGTPFCE